MRDRGPPVTLSARRRRFELEADRGRHAQLSLPSSRRRTCMWHACGMRCLRKCMNAMCRIGAKLRKKGLARCCLLQKSSPTSLLQVGWHDALTLSACPLIPTQVAALPSTMEPHASVISPKLRAPAGYPDDTSELAPDPSPRGCPMGKLQKQRRGSSRRDADESP